LPQNIALGTIGQYGYYRGLLAMSHTIGENDLYGYNGRDRVLPDVNPGTFLGAIEAFHNDGPWDPPENFRKLKFALRYSQGSSTDGLRLMVNGYSGAWTGEPQLAERAIREHVVGYFGNLDPSDGGDSQRYMFTAWHGQLTDNSYTKSGHNPCTTINRLESIARWCKRHRLEALLLYAVASLRWVRGSAVRMTFGYRSTRRRAM
jgi:hypothetical protein